MQRPAAFALLCVFLAFGAALVVSRTTFERLPHLEDEFAYLYQARVFASGEVTIPTSHPRRAYWQPFLLDMNGQRFAKYPPGWPLVLAGGVRAGAPWTVNAWLAMLTVALVYRLGREWDGPATGAIAALLTATSPAALLLNGSLMGHTAGLFGATLALYAVWRLERGRGKRAARYAWGALAGLALGVLLINRPLTGLAVAAPLAACSARRVIGTAWQAGGRAAGRALGPLALLAAVLLLVGAIWPAYNHAVSARRGESFPAYLGRFLARDPDTNLYLRVWPYDRVGFGPGHGRAAGGHTLARGWDHARSDLRCAARDAFGWARPPEAGVSPDDACESGGGWSYWSALPLAFALVAGWRDRWTWLLLGVPVALIAAQMAYWVGAGVYGARYYFEGLTAVALLAALGLDRLRYLLGGSRAGRAAFWIGLLGLAAYALAIYAPARLAPLHGYGAVSRAEIAAVEALRQDPDRPLVVIAVGEHRWREVAAIMALTPPDRAAEIILARDPTGTTWPEIVAQFPDREVIYYRDGTFSHVPPPEHLSIE
jgi:hypothetical protein